MADPIQSAQSINEQTAAINNRDNALLKAVESTNKFNDAQVKVAESYKKMEAAGTILNSAQKKIVELFGNFTKVAKETAATVVNFAEKLSGGKFSLDGLIAGLQGGAEKNELLINSLAKGYVAIDVFRKNVSQTSPALRQMMDDVGGSSKVVQKFGEDVSKVMTDRFKLPKELGEMTSNFFAGTAAVRAFETSILQAATAGGNINAVLKLIGREGSDLGENLDQTMTAVSKGIYNLGISSNIGVEESTKAYMDTLRTMPGEVGKIYNLTSSANKDYVLTSDELMAKVALGAGIKFEEARNMAKGMLDTFGLDSQKAAERISALNKVSGDLQIPLGELESVTKNLDQAFGLWGNQASGTMGILQNVSKGLEGTNIGWKGQLDIVNKLTTSIGSMSLGMRSFIGIQSGLRGGAVSAGLQIEKMLQEGKMDEIANMMQQTLEKQTGRKAITLTEATEGGAQTENAFMRQRAMLQTMGVSGEATQNALLNAMSKISIGGATGIDAQKELKSVLTEGQARQDRQTNHSALIAEHTEQLVGFASRLEAYNEERKNLGITAQGNEIVTGIKREQAAGETGNQNAANLGITGAKDFAKASVSGGVGVLNTSFGYIKAGWENIKNDLAKITDPEEKKSKQAELDKSAEQLLAIRRELNKGLNKKDAKIAEDKLKQELGISSEEPEPSLPKPPKVNVKLKGKPGSKIELPEEERPTLSGRTGAARTSAEKETQQQTGPSAEAHVYVHIVDQKGNEIAVQSVSAELLRLAKATQLKQ